MFTPAEAIKELDAALAAAGQDVFLHAVAAGVPVEPGLKVRAFVRGFKPEQLVSDIRQTDRKVILSPTGLGEVPIKGSKVNVGGKVFNVEGHPEQIQMADVLVRVEMQVRG